MKYIVWYFFIGQSLSATLHLALLAYNKYPRKMEDHGQIDDLTTFVARAALAMWAAWVIFR